MNANADWAVALVRRFSLLDGIKVGVNYSIQIEGDHAGDVDEHLEIEFFVRSDKLRQIDGREVAHGSLLWRDILYNLRAQVAVANSPEVFLVGFFVARVFVQHVRGPRLYL